MNVNIVALRIYGAMETNDKLCSGTKSYCANYPNAETDFLACCQCENRMRTTSLSLNLAMCTAVNGMRAMREHKFMCAERNALTVHDVSESEDDSRISLSLGITRLSPSK